MTISGSDSNSEWLDRNSIRPSLSETSAITQSGSTHVFDRHMICHEGKAGGVVKGVPNSGGKYKIVPTQLMAELERRLLPPACLLLVFGIPACGKTLLTRSILNHVGDRQQADWSWVAIHHDDFYPPDSRSKIVS